MAAVPMDPILQSHGSQSLSGSFLADEVSLSLYPGTTTEPFLDLTKLFF